MTAAEQPSSSLLILTIFHRLENLALGLLRLVDPQGHYGLAGLLARRRGGRHGRVLVGVFFGGPLGLLRLARGS